MEPYTEPVRTRPRVLPLRPRLGMPPRKAWRRQGDSYPSWVLDQMGVDVMLANRVAMGRGIAPPRFLWVPYADALMYPLDNAGLIGRAPDYKEFFADEERLLHRYLKEAGLAQARFAR